MFGYFLFALMMAVITAMVAGSKGFNWFVWFLYGCVLWPIALVHALLRAPANPRPVPVVVTQPYIPPPQRAISTPTPIRAPQAAPAPAATKICPMCAEEVKAAARVCRFCRHEFPEPEPAAPAPKPQDKPYVSTWAPSPIPPGMKACPRCGAANSPDVQICSSCGGRLRVSGA